MQCVISTAALSLAIKFSFIPIRRFIILKIFTVIAVLIPRLSYFHGSPLLFSCGGCRPNIIFGRLPPLIPLENRLYFIHHLMLRLHSAINTKFTLVDIFNYSIYNRWINISALRKRPGRGRMVPITNDLFTGIAQQWYSVAYTRKSSRMWCHVRFVKYSEKFQIFKIRKRFLLILENCSLKINTTIVNY